MNAESRSYTNTLISLIVESVIIGILVNLLSDYIASYLQMDVFTVSLLLFVLLAVGAVYVLFQMQWKRPGDMAPQKPAELGSMLSLVFFARHLFLDCATGAEFDRWFLIGLGSVPLLAGLGMTSFLDAKHRFTGKMDEELLMQKLVIAQQAKQAAEESATRTRHELEGTRRALQEVQASKPAQPPTTVRDARDADEEEQRRRLDMRSVIQGNLDVERQLGVLLVIIESILSVKKTVSQMEIFEVCRALTRNLPVANLFALIREFMGSFVSLRQSIRGVNLNTEDRANWTINESTPYWKKNI